MSAILDIFMMFLMGHCLIIKAMGRYLEDSSLRFIILFVSDKYRYKKTMEKTSKIFVAGHRGLVGSAIVRELEQQGYKNILKRSRAELDLLRQSAVEDFFEQEKPEYVFLAAARVGGILANDIYRGDFILENLQIQNNVIGAAFKFTCKKLLFLGSSCIYPKLSPQPIPEEALLTGSLEPTNEAYALAKIAGLMLCKSLKLQHLAFLHLVLILSNTNLTIFLKIQLIKLERVVVKDHAMPTGDIATALDTLVENLPIASSIVRDLLSTTQMGTIPTIEDIYTTFKEQVEVFSSIIDELASDNPELSDAIWTVEDELTKRIDTLYTQFKKLSREQPSNEILGRFAIECEVHFRGVIGEIAAVYFFNRQLFVQNIRFDYKGFRDKKLNRKARQFLSRIRSALKTKRDYYLSLPESSWASELEDLKRKFKNLIPPTFIAKSVGSWIGLFSMLANIEFDGFLRAAIPKPGDDQDYQALEVKALRNLGEREDAFLTALKSVEKRKEFFEFLEMNIPIVLYLPYGCSPSQLQMLRSKNIQVHQGLPSSSEMVILDIEIVGPEEL
jgi:hypothetical protein